MWAYEKGHKYYNMAPFIGPYWYIRSPITCTEQYGSYFGAILFPDNGAAHLLSCVNKAQYNLSKESEMLLFFREGRTTIIKNNNTFIINKGGDHRPIIKLPLHQYPIMLMI